MIQYLPYMKSNKLVKARSAKCHPKKDWPTTNLPVVSVEEGNRITDINVEQTAVVAKGSQSADSGDNDIVLNDFLGQSTNVLDDSRFQRLIEDDPVEFQGMLGEGESAFRAEQTFGQTAEKVTFLSDAVQLETTGQTSIPLKGKMRATENGRRWEMRLCWRVGGPLNFSFLKSYTEVRRRSQQYWVELGLLVRCRHILAVLTQRKLWRCLDWLNWKWCRGLNPTKCTHIWNSALEVDFFVCQHSVRLVCLPLWKLLRRSFIKISQLRAYWRFFSSSILRPMWIRLIKRRVSRRMKWFSSRRRLAWRYRWLLSGCWRTYIYKRSWFVGRT